MEIAPSPIGVAIAAIVLLNPSIMRVLLHEEMYEKPCPFTTQEKNKTSHQALPMGRL
jgi:hypothetical protein